MIDIYLTEEAGELHFTLRIGNDIHRLTFEEAERAAALLEVTLRQYNRTHGKRAVAAVKP